MTDLTSEDKTSLKISLREKDDFLGISILGETDKSIIDRCAIVIGEDSTFHVKGPGHLTNNILVARLKGDKLFMLALTRKFPFISMWRI